MKMEAQIKLVNIEDIIPNRFQPRLEFDDEDLKTLADSIRVHGIVQPLVLRRVQNKFEIIAGERRYKASKLIGLPAVPAIITNLDDNESAEVAIIENTHRKNLNAIEEAKSYKKLLDRRYVTQDQLAKRLGTSQSNIANKVRLLSLDENVQDALVKERISERHARSLLKCTDKFKQVELLNKTIEEKWTVKKLDEEIDKIIGTYKTQNNVTGGISLNKNDINVDSIKSSATTMDFGPVENKQLYNYNVRPTEEKKKSIFFNNLENESVNMGFNPFDANRLNTNAIENIETLNDEIEDEEDINTINKVNSQEVLDIKINSVEATLEAIKKLNQIAKENLIPLEIEEFNFDKIHQFIIRIDKEN